MKRIAAITCLTFGLWAAPVAAQVKDFPADNSGTNVRDRDADAVTAGQQSNSKADLATTQEIRRAIVADESLSTNAHNVKVITAAGVVTLRGPVKNTAERTTIVRMARAAVGVTRVDDEIEITGD
jgi:hyperosmotically inducible protein